MVYTHEENCDECDYCIEDYYDYDTGYSEYKCDLTGQECTDGAYDSGCPLAFKYIVKK